MATRHRPTPHTHAAALLPNITLDVSRQVASGLSRPVYVTHAGDGSGRLFVVEQSGHIKIIRDGSVLPTPFFEHQFKSNRLQ